MRPFKSLQWAEITETHSEDIREKVAGSVAINWGKAYAKVVHGPFHLSIPCQTIICVICRCPCQKQNNTIKKLAYICNDDIGIISDGIRERLEDAKREYAEHESPKVKKVRWECGRAWQPISGSKMEAGTESLSGGKQQTTV